MPCKKSLNWTHSVSPAGELMDWALLLRGFLLGFSIAAPVGPIGILCIRRTLTDGWLTGFLSGLGAATADMLYGGIAAFGLTAVVNLLVGLENWLRLAGGLFLLYLGLRAFLSKPPAASTSPRGIGRLNAYATTFFLTLTNPMTILFFTGMLSALLPTSGEITPTSPLNMVLGVFLGSAAWWLFLSGLASLVREKFTSAWLGWINRASGLAITAFALVALAGLVK